MIITDKFLGDGEYYKEVTEKDTIYLHHTAGSHRPDWVIAGWDADDTIDPTTKKKKPRAVATSFVIGGIAINNDNTFDGTIYRAFDEQYWAHHIGSTNANNKTLNKKSIGIEICNYGPITKSKDGKFYNYVNGLVPKDHVIELEKPFRGYKYYHKYSDNQIAAVKFLIQHLISKYPKIKKTTPLVNFDGFELNNDVINGVKYGIVSHSNIRKDKFDISPQPNMINMLKNLYI